MLSLCRAFGLLVETEASIPGALPADEANFRAPDLRICKGGTELSDESTRSGPYRLGREGLLFEKAGVARYLCSPDGDTMQVEAQPGVSAADVSAYLVATALPAILWMRGELVLHGAAFVPAREQRAFALLGKSGSGKSTLLRGLVEAGASVVAEDSLCLRERNGSLEVSGLPACLHLRDLGPSLEADRTLLAVPLSQCRASAQLGPIVVLEPSDDGTSSLTKVSAASAVALLLHHRHRPRVPDLLGRSADLLPRWAAIAGAIPVYFWRSPRVEFRSASHGAAGRLLAALNDCLESAS